VIEKKIFIEVLFLKEQRKKKNKMVDIYKKPYKAFIASHTHWDGEWYRTFTI